MRANKGHWQCLRALVVAVLAAVVQRDGEEEGRGGQWRRSGCPGGELTGSLVKATATGGGDVGCRWRRSRLPRWWLLKDVAGGEQAAGRAAAAERLAEVAAKGETQQRRCTGDSAAAGSGEQLQGASSRELPWVAGD